MSTPNDSPKPLSGWIRRLKDVRDLLEYEDKEKWVTEMKGSLSLTASIIATMTFQLATNPPGGVVQASLSDDVRCSNRTGVYMCAGEAVLAVIHKENYLAFLTCNIISFVAGLFLLLLSGIPLKDKYAIWPLSIGMFITVTSLAFTYHFAATMVTPTSIWRSLGGYVNRGLMVFGASLAVIVAALLILRFFVRRL